MEISSRRKQKVEHHDIWSSKRTENMCKSFGG